jgi:hypothetical protein
MAATYKDLINTLIKREFGILGKDRMMGILSDLEMKVDKEGALVDGDYSISELDALTQTLSDKYGAVAVMGCKVAVGRMAKENGLKLPRILS